ncbi:MAG: M12 family metallo-peptidase, partial [Candidatus Binatia bacterium]
LGRVFHPYDDTSPRSTREEIPSDGACNGPCPTTEGGLRLRSEQAARHPGRETGVSPDFIRATISPLVSHDPLGGLPASTLQARQAPPRQGPPSNVLYFEPLTNVSIKTTADTQQADGRGRLQVSFAAFGKQFDLQLEPNNLFAPDAKNIWIDNETKTVEASTPLFYQGEIAGEPNSWIRISMQDGVMDGMIRSKEETYFVEPGERFLAGPSPTPMVMYRLSDTTSDWKPGSCALDHPTVASAMGHHALATEPISDYDAVRAELRALAGSTLEQIDLGIVADYEYFLKYGPSAATTMQNIINQVDGIFRSELGVSLRVTTTIVYTTPNDPFSDTTDPEALLDEFDSYKGNSASPIRGTGLAHLFTRRDFAGETVG